MYQTILVKTYKTLSAFAIVSILAASILMSACFVQAQSTDSTSQRMITTADAQFARTGESSLDRQFGWGG